MFTYGYSAKEYDKFNLWNLNIEKPTTPIISNVTSIPTQEIEEIRENLINQITGRVRWRESILFMKKSVQKIFEIGPGRVLCNLIKRIEMMY